MIPLVITNTGDNPIAISGCNDLPAGACFSWYVDVDNPVTISGNSSFFIKSISEEFVPNLIVGNLASLAMGEIFPKEGSVTLDGSLVLSEESV